MNFPVPTWGHPGWRPWYDVYIEGGWRIQRHETRELHRTVSPQGRKYVRESFEDCQTLICAAIEPGTTAIDKELIIIVPGLNNAVLYYQVLRHIFIKAGYDCVIWDYGTNYTDARGHAARLLNLTRALNGRRVSFVTHSLGGLILRVLLAGDHGLNLGRVVMIAPPHGGSFMADMVRDQLKLPGLYQWMCGAVGHDLTTPGATSLPPVAVPVGIMLGGAGRKGGLNPLSAADNDGWVALESSLLPNAADTIQIRGWGHTIMMANPRTAREAVHFLQTGRFTGAAR